MGNKGSNDRRQEVDSRYTRPQGLYQHKDLDEKRLKKSILEFKLAPCYIGEDEFEPDLEGCPICFLYYPSLNRSKCCSQSICTECFLQVKPHLSTRHVQCPFCKTPNYAVEYCGVKTMEEKHKEQIEEQKVIEAQLRVRQQEMLDENERLQKRKEKDPNSSSTTSPTEEEYRDLCGVSQSVAQTTTESEEFLSSQSSSRTLSSGPSPSRNVRNGTFELDLEEVMLMEAIWLSIQEQESPLLYQNTLETLEPTPSNSSTGFASAVADLAERQHRLLAPSTSSSYVDNNLLEPSSSSIENMHGSPIRGVVNGDVQPIDQWSTIGAEHGRNIPESFEEQMRLALALSLAEARARVSV